MMIYPSFRLVLLPSCLHGWIPSFSSSRLVGNQFRQSTVLHASYEDDDSSWSAADDWSTLSAAENPTLEGQDVFCQDMAERAAQRLQAGQENVRLSPQDVWLHESIGQILNPTESIRTTSTEDYESTMKDEAQGAQVAMLVRCQQVSEEFLVEQGRAVADLTWELAHHVRQLINWNAADDWWQATDYLSQAVQTMFAQHQQQQGSSNDNYDEDESNNTNNDWDAAAVSSWMRQSLQEPCGKHDPRVLTVLSTFGNNGRLKSQGLEQLYVQALVGPKPHENEEKRDWSGTQIGMHLNRIMSEEDAISTVWRDLKRHGLQSPAELAHAEAWRSVQERHEGATPSTASSSTTIDSSLIMDECEIINDAIPDGWYKDYHTGAWQRHGKSSHEKVQMSADGATPLLLQDGDYVYIDEESCIGCTQCALAAPASFQMLENGRARTFLQRGRSMDVTAAVKTCPVNCMHYVDFERLQSLEQARDSLDADDGREDHRHFGRDKRHNADKWRAHTPLYVARMESSDANHKDSLYNHMVRQCYKSAACPSKGCYDCPMHKNNPEANPALLERRKASLHTRAQTFCDNGTADLHRKTVEL
eukprot:scaffold227_cov165-Amphora_coffeaeformis.AAC.13